jgi:hypothetical protein
MANRTQPSEISIVKLPGLALGDWIECEFSLPHTHTRGVHLLTAESVVYGRNLISDPKSGWRRATRDWSAGTRSQEPAQTLTDPNNQVLG